MWGDLAPDSSRRCQDPTITRIEDCLDHRFCRAFYVLHSIDFIIGHMSGFFYLCAQFSQFVLAGVNFSITEIIDGRTDTADCEDICNIPSVTNASACSAYTGG